MKSKKCKCTDCGCENTKVVEVEECCGCCCEEESSCCEKEKEEDKGCKCSGCECLCER